MKQSGRQLDAPSGARAGGVVDAPARHRFDASFPSVKIGIIVLAWSAVLQAIWPIFYIDVPGSPVLDQLDFVLAHLALLLAASAVIWLPVWRELHGKSFGESMKSASFHVHVWATAMMPLLGGYYGLASASYLRNF